jgi:hypothetical protein
MACLSASSGAGEFIIPITGAKQSPGRGQSISPKQKGAPGHCPRSAGFQTCCIADFPIGSAPKLLRSLSLSKFADLAIRDTADLEVGATGAVSGYDATKKAAEFSAAQ